MELHEFIEMMEEYLKTFQTSMTAVGCVKHENEDKWIELYTAWLDWHRNPD